MYHDICRYGCHPATSVKFDVTLDWYHRTALLFLEVLDACRDDYQLASVVKYVVSCAQTCRAAFHEQIVALLVRCL
jgi:hypothetical protein